MQNDIDSFDPFDRAFLADPWSTLSAVREKCAALHVPKADFYLLTRHADVSHAAKRPDVFSSTGGVGVAWEPHPMLSMYDPPKHTDLRRLIAPFFTPKAMERYASAIQRAVDASIDDVLARGQGDAARDIAETISLATVGELLGIGVERREDLRTWAENTIFALAADADGASPEAAEASRRQFVRYLRSAIAERRAEPGTDLVSTLLHANDIERLSENELVTFCVLLLVAGFDSPKSAMANVFQVLARFEIDPPSLPADPAGQLAFASEVVRFEPAVNGFFRVTLQDTQVGDVAIPSGKKVMLHFAAANRDPAAFPDPDRFDPARAPGDNLAFGDGPHRCLGFALARLQLTTLLRTLRQRVRRIRRAEPETRRDNLLFRGFSRLPLTFEPL